MLSNIYKKRIHVDQVGDILKRMAGMELTRNVHVQEVVNKDIEPEVIKFKRGRPKKIN